MPKSIADRTEPSVVNEEITKSDTVNFTNGVCRGIYVGGTGDVVIVDADGTAVTFTGVPAGTILPVAAKRVNSTNTTATSMVAMF